MYAGDLRAAVLRAIWGREAEELPRHQAWLIGVLRFAFVLGRDLAQGQLTLRAMSLVYTTLLSLVPLLAVSFSVLQAFGVHNRTEPFLHDLLAPLGESGAEITDRLIEFVENMNVGVLGSVGFVLLFYTVVSLVHKIERTFNHIWHIDKHRALVQRFSNYLSVILIGPVLAFSALGLTTSVMDSSVMKALVEVELLGQLFGLAARLVPFVLLAGGFTLLYTFLPNTKVKFSAGLVGGLIAALLWHFAGSAFRYFVATSTNYTLVYSAFATLVFFMIWLYLAWVIVLIGASIAFYRQHPEYINRFTEKLVLSNRVKERLALVVMTRIVTDFYAERPPVHEQALAQELRVPVSALQTVLHALTGQGFLVRTAEHPAAYLPARPLDTTRVRDVLSAVRTAEERQSWQGRGIVSSPVIERLMDRLDDAFGEAFEGCTLKELADEDSATAQRVSARRE